MVDEEWLKSTIASAMKLKVKKCVITFCDAASTASPVLFLDAKKGGGGVIVDVVLYKDGLKAAKEKVVL